MQHEGTPLSRFARETHGELAFSYMGLLMWHCGRAEKGKVTGGL